MDRQRSRRALVGVNRAPRTRPVRAARRLDRTDRLRPASPATDEAALAFLSEILVGDREWTVAEVRRLISMRESAELGRWRAGPDGGAGGAA
jgi:hypothetical protein